jgi:hypothetical protein
VIPAEFLDPDDTGERYVIERMSGMLAGNTVRYMIIDRNTDKPMRGNKQPDDKGKFIWKGPRDVAVIMCAALNESVKPRLMDAGTGPDAPVHSVDAAIVAWGKRAASPRIAVPTFVQCAECARCHRAGACP